MVTGEVSGDLDHVYSGQGSCFWACAEPMVVGREGSQSCVAITERGGPSCIQLITVLKDHDRGDY
jgi:hypothetical protein